jgi:hypothetical protein
MKHRKTGMVPSTTEGTDSLKPSIRRFEAVIGAERSQEDYVEL